MPGVNITTAVRTGPVGTGDIVSSQVFMVGLAERGELEAPVLVRSFSDYTTYYGNYQGGNLYAHVKTFFDEGGSRCQVMRVLGNGGEAGRIELKDAAGSATMLIEAQNAGAWSDNLEVAVIQPDVAGFRLEFYLDGLMILRTRDLTSTNDGCKVINASDIHHLVEATDIESSSLNPDPAENNDGDRTPLSGGLNGDPVETSDVLDAMDRMSVNVGPGAVCAPGMSGEEIWDGLRNHADMNKRIALLSFPPGESASAVKTSASTYYADPYAKGMAFYWPHIKVPAPGVSELATGVTSVQGSTVTISPEAFAAGARAKAIQAAGGPWRAGAGIISAATNIEDLAVDVTPAAGDALDNARVNALRKIGNSIRVYGARSASNDEANWRYITQQDTLNFIVDGVETRMERYVFSTIDGRGGLFGRIRGSIKGFLDPIRVAGGLFEAYDDDGVLVDPGYAVIVNSDINPATRLATGVVNAQIGVRVSGVADLIDIVITKSNLSAPII